MENYTNVNKFTYLCRPNLNQKGTFIMSKSNLSGSSDITNTSSTELVVDKDFFKKNSMELYLKEEYGIDDVLAEESVDLRQNRVFNFDVSSVRGNIQLQLGKIRTPQDYKNKLDMVVKKLKKLKIL